MKKTKIFAAISAALLLSSVLIPAAAFGQASQQQGSQQITGAETPIFLEYPTDFGFDVFNAPPTTDTDRVHYGGNATYTEHQLAIQDLRGIIASSFDVTLTAGTTFNDGGTNVIPLDFAPTANGNDGGYFIGLDYTGLTGTADTATSTIVYDTGAQNHNTYGAVIGNADLDLINGANPSDPGDYPTADTSDLEEPLVLMEMTAITNTEGFSGNVRTGVYDYVVVPAFQNYGTYGLTKVYTLTYA